ncbi:MAG: hypothetical protein LC687_00030 [Actinobacteria bacterium]|nr:hypothetical protein [Actinomycetota bacterium]
MRQQLNRGEVITIDIFSRFKKNRIPIRVGKVKASRAVYESADIQRIELTIITAPPHGEELILEFTPPLAHKAILEMSLAYNAINPPITNPRPNMNI